MRYLSTKNWDVLAVMLAGMLSSCVAGTSSEDYTRSEMGGPDVIADTGASEEEAPPLGQWPGTAGAGSGTQADAASAAGATGTPEAGTPEAGTPEAGTTGTADASVGQPEAAPPPPPLDCSPIESANPAWAVCESGVNRCAGVFSNGSGCNSYCAAAGLVCVASYGGEPGCVKETSSLGCAWTGHESDWCECAAPDGGVIPDSGPDPATCPTNPGNPQQLFEYDTGDAVFEQRNNWVVDCSPHAYTANNSEHESCDNDYHPDGSRRGKAIFTFPNVPKGLYDVYVESKHTKNRNPDGALFYVNSYARVINQVSDPSAYVWDLHGRYCLEGAVVVTLDSTVNGGSDAVSGVRLVPAG